MTSLISVAFWAMLSLQTFWYFASYERDNKSLKFLVVFIWIISTAQTYVIVYGAWVYIIDDFGDYASLLRIIPPYAAQLIFTATATVTVQAFFVFRICRLSGDSKMVTIMWAPLAIFQIVAALIIVIKTCLSGEGSYVWAPLPTDLGIAYLAVSLFIDIAIAMFLLVLLHRHKEQTRIQSTLRVIQRLMLLAVVNMVCSTAFAICDLVLFVAMDGNMYYALFDIPICSLYCNTLLANLNMRASLAEQQSVVEMDLTSFVAIGPKALALTVKNESKVSTQSGSRQSSELGA
ncbi:hypothetical protein K503DRAFT_771133 [Rhizopogon vinicolor AM-OR11-026]|uniref:DUF6534 domain-containing protein n=1 Tax=Rhizopogon vinicolor AM-OR11-026 TaxID=1314800 RepID=A0A1B7MYW5_9AGAM|nr:hypothetical protein K503DRAFT_771133 [Rhizopogon vinicolor AM-OR11-026]